MNSRHGLLLGVVLLGACAPKPVSTRLKSLEPAGYPMLKGRTLGLRLLDEAGFLDGDLARRNRLEEAVRTKLLMAGATIADEAPQTLVLALRSPPRGNGVAENCVMVTAHFQRVDAAFLPSREFESVSCSSPEHESKRASNDGLGVLIELGFRAAVVEAERSNFRALAIADGLDAVLLQVGNNPVP